MNDSDKKYGATGSLLMYSGMNFVLMLFISLLYFTHSKHDIGDIVPLFIADISNCFMLSLPPLLIVLPLGKVHASVRKYVSISVYFVFMFFFLFDACIYKVLKIHFNSLVVNVILTKGGLKSLDFSTTMTIATILLIVLILVVEIILYSVSERHSLKYPVHAVIVLLSIVLIDKTIYAYADLYNMTIITRNAKVLPLYQPLTIRRFAEKRLHMNITQPVTVAIDRSKSLLDYPRESLRCNKIQGAPNIVWILIDSWRYDMFSKDLTPNIYEFGKKALVLANHYSGGNASRFGVFTLFYGLYGSYWFPMLGERRGPVFIDALRDMGYEFRMLLSSRVTFPEFDKTCFVNVPPQDIMDDAKLPSKTKSGRDNDITAAFTAWLDTAGTSRPYFAFLFFDAPHGSYEYPPEFEKFTNTVGEFSYLFLNKENIIPVFNRYRNSIYYDDYLVGKILKKLGDTGQLKNTIVLISGDHGEAFFEKGISGHNEGYPTEVVSVPLVLYVPGRPPERRTSLTSHLDVVPTLLPMLGCTTTPSAYSQGRPLFEKEADRNYVVSSSWADMAIIDSRQTMVMPLELYRNPRIVVYDKNYTEIVAPRFTSEDLDRINRTLKGLSYFMK